VSSRALKAPGKWEFFLENCKCLLFTLFTALNNAKIIKRIEEF